MVISAPPTGRPLHHFRRFDQYRDPDQICIAVAEYHCEHEYRVCDARGEPNAWMNVLDTPEAKLTSLGYGVESTARPGQLDFYVVLYLVAGAGRFRYGRDSAERTAGQAVVASMQKPLGMRLSGDAVVACLCINESTLRHRLQGALGEVPAAPLEFELVMNDGDRSVAEWLQLFRGELNALDNPSSLFRTHRLMTHDSINFLVGRLMHAQPHNYTELIEGAPGLFVPSRRTREVREYIAAHPSECHTLASLAKIACCSEAALNKAFNRDFGESPMRYVKHFRLEGAHRDLIAGDPSETKVKRIAEKWGFRHEGHFAELHRQVYGDTPHLTLKG